MADLEAGGRDVTPMNKASAAADHGGGEPTRRQFMEGAAALGATAVMAGSLLDVSAVAAQLNDGVPQTSFVVPAGGSYTYEFMAPHAGTYHYHCHVDTIMHYHRGMSGVVIVRPPDGSIDRAWDGGPTFDEEVAWQLQTYDITWDVQGESGPFTARHHPNYFLLNGKQTAQALTDPYTVVNLSVGQRAYLRVVNMSYQWGRVALGGLPFEVVASDGRPMRKTAVAKAWEIGPGERYDLLLQADEPTKVDATVDYLDDYTHKVLGQAATRVTIS